MISIILAGSSGSSFIFHPNASPATVLLRVITAACRTPTRPRSASRGARNTHAAPAIASRGLDRFQQSKLFQRKEIRTSPRGVLVELADSGNSVVRGEALRLLEMWAGIQPGRGGKPGCGITREVRLRQTAQDRKMPAKLRMAAFKAVVFNLGINEQLRQEAELRSLPKRPYRRKKALQDTADTVETSSPSVHKSDHF